MSLFEATDDNIYKNILIDTRSYFESMKDPKTKLFFHAVYNLKLDRYPQFIAGAGIILDAAYQINNLLQDDFPHLDTLNEIFDRQYSNGSFPNFIGKNLTINRQGRGEVWEDAAAGVNWNAHLLEYLSVLCPNPKNIKTS